MRVRIAMLGVGDGTVAETVEDVTIGVKVPWVELDGHRFEDIVAATFEAAGDGISTCRLVLEPIGRVELVYVDHDGDPLPGNAETVDDPTSLGRLDYSAVHEVQR